jgi:hypothetical protein
MDGLNKQFSGNPKQFLETYCVDNSKCQQGNAGSKDLLYLNDIKVGQFDFLKTGGNSCELRILTPWNLAKLGSGSLAADTPITAYWCPFLPGIDEVGNVDIPTANPSYRFILTAAMQGCWFAVKPSPHAGHFRVFHNQHPDNPKSWTAMGGKDDAISFLEYGEYGQAGGEGGTYATNAFNCLWYDGQSWKYLSQSNRFVPGAKGFSIARDATKPILQKNAGV